MGSEELERQIAQEALELKNAPVIKPIVGQVKRCHICGRPFEASQIKPFDDGAREACNLCHPNRGSL